MQAIARRYLAFVCAAFLVAPAASAAPYVPLPPTDDYVHAMGDCSTLEACLAALDTVVPATDRGVGLNDDRVRQKLLQFGDAAKERLLELAVGEHPGWRNLAGDILGDWPDLAPEDVPALRRALELRPNGWPARALGLIGTDEAVDALLADFKDAGGQTAYGLRRVGPKVLPRLLPALSTPEKQRGAMSVIRDMGEPASVIAPEWAQIAIDPTRPKPERIGALKGLEALGPHARGVSGMLHPLLTGADREVAAGAFSALLKAGDPVVVPLIAAGCTGYAEPTDRYPKADLCLGDIAGFGAEGRPGAPAVRAYFASPNREERLAAASTAGFIGDEGSTPLLIAELNSPDWRAVFAAARSLGWIGAPEARPALTATAAGHWLPEVRAEAQRALDGIVSAEGHTRRSEPFFRDRADSVAFTPDGSILGRSDCPGRRWVWEGRRVNLPQEDDRIRRRSVKLADGMLVALDEGEWGGSLAWRPARGALTELRGDNATGVVRSAEGAVASFGLAHLASDYGYLLRLSRAGPGAPWVLNDIGTLPGASSPISTLQPGLFTVVSRGRLVVFNDQEILGLGECAP